MAKRILAIFLVLCFTLSVSTNVFAAELTPNEPLEMEEEYITPAAMEQKSEEALTESVLDELSNGSTDEIEKGLSASTSASATFGIAEEQMAQESSVAEVSEEQLTDDDFESSLTEDSSGSSEANGRVLDIPSLGESEQIEKDLSMISVKETSLADSNTEENIYENTGMDTAHIELNMDASLQETSKFMVSVESTTGKAGSTVDVDVTIVNNPGIIGGELTLVYDNKLILKDASSGNAFISHTMTRPGSLESPCKFVWDAGAFSQEDIADGVILTLTFQVSDTAATGEALAVDISSFEGFSYLNLSDVVSAETSGGKIILARDSSLISSTAGRMSGTQASISFVSAEDYSDAFFALAGYSATGKMEYITTKKLSIVKGENALTVSDLKTDLIYSAFLLGETLTPLCPKIPVELDSDAGKNASLLSNDVRIAILSIERVSSLPGATVAVNVRIMNNPGILGAALTLNYDNSRMTLKNASSGSAFQPLSFDKSGRLTSPCKFMWDGTEIAKDDIKDGVILTLEFEIAAETLAPSTLPIRISYVTDEVVDSRGNPVELRISQGSISIVDYIPGDVNGDQSVRVNDVVLIRRHNLGGYDISINTDAADVNDDRAVNTRDVILVRQHIAGGYGVVLLPSGVSCSHELEEVPYQAPTDTRIGNIQYWQCTICGKCFSDSTGAKEISFDETILNSIGLDAGEHRIFYDIANGDPYIQKLVDNGLLANLNEEPNRNTFRENQNLTLTPLTVDGYQFDGWFNGPGNNATQVREIPVGTVTDIYLYAHWTENPYNVYYKSSLTLNKTQSTYTTRRGLVLPTPEYSGYVFTGWSDENGKLYDGSMIPAGTTGDITLTANWTSERNRTYTKPSLDDPIIYEDEKNGEILFVYEIGEIRNVPLYTIVDFGKILGDGITETRTYTSSNTISDEAMKAYAASASKATTESSSWTLSDEWNKVSSIDEEWCREYGVSKQAGEIIAKSDTGNWNISNSANGSTDTTHVDTNAKNWENQVKINSSTENKSTDKTAASFDSTVKADGAFVKAEISAGLDVENEYSTTNKEGLEVGGTNGNQDLHTDTTTTTSGWNNSASYGGSQTNSRTKETSVTLSELINEKYHYGNSYATGETSTEMKGLSASTTSEESYSSSVTYLHEVTEAKTNTYTTTSAKSGFYRQVMAGTAHVFGVVGYNLAGSSFYVYTYSVMDDEQHPFWDYSATTSAYNDMENGVIPFEIPYDLAEYVAELTCASSGLSVDQQKGIITGYTGTDNCVVIPEYKVLEDGKVIKITGISADAFRNNKDIVAVVLSDYITAIPANAFEGCTSLKGITGGAITEIGANAFKGCIAIENAGINQNVTKLGENAFKGADRLVVRASSGAVAEGAVKSGAKRIVLHMDYLEKKDYDLQGKSFAIPEGTEYFEMDGIGAVYEDFSLVSNADQTILREINFQSAVGIPVQINSPEVAMDNVTASAAGIALVLSADETRLGLQGTIVVSSQHENAMLTKTLSRYNLLQGVDGNLKVDGALLVCGTYTDDSYITYGTLKKIDSEKFESLLHSYTLTFDAQGGECETNSREISNSMPVGELPIPRRTHYGFDGWYLADGVTKIVPETVFSDGVNRTVYAHWKPNQCNLRFDANVGSCSETIRTITLTVKVGSLPSASRTGYAFDGWYLTNGSRLTAETVFTEEIDQIATARWTANTYTVNYNGNGGSCSASNKVVTYGSSYGTLADASRVGYTFSGWYTASSGGDRVYPSTTVLTASNHTLYAHWDIVRVTIPNFSGQYVGDVRNWCNSNGVKYSESWAHDWGVTRDHIRSNSHAESTVDWGSTTITLYVSSGEKDIGVGDTVYVDAGTQYWGTSGGGGGTGWFTNGITGRVSYMNPGARYPYNINGTGWVSAGAVHQRTN